MMRTILRKPQVNEDLIGHYAYIALDKIEPAERFLRVAEESFQRLLTMPAIGTKWVSKNKALAGIYVYPLSTPYRSYLMFYRLIPDGIELLTILHGARNLERALRQILIPP
ncbi:MAG: type II toxin-antitoxin system RelE/ParE family toxin [Phycisphaerales bacterium]|nr:type II toxin-antitoxin system RelE/ParE family toxin [Phycisphaerales bacterium]